jgi:hypothetical protein
VVAISTSAPLTAVRDIYLTPVGGWVKLLDELNEERSYLSVLV